MAFLLPLFIFLLDRLAKALAVKNLAGIHGGVPLIPGVIRLLYAENTGMAFGLLSGQRWLLVLFTLIAAVAAFFALKPYRLGHWAKASLLTIAGGMAGNLVDRALQGYVVDMFDFTFVRFAVFNVADIAITLGAVFLCISLLFRPKDWKKKEEGKATA